MWSTLIIKVADDVLEKINKYCYLPPLRFKLTREV